MSAPKSSGYKHLWQRSSSPVEDFSGSTGDLWGYEIVGEEIDDEGQPRYEVRWENWSRPDGTQTTWHSKPDPDIDTSIWDERRKSKLNHNATESLAIYLQSTTDFHNSATYEHHQALCEKLALSKQNPPNQVEETMALMEYHRRMENPETLGDLPPLLEISSVLGEVRKRLSSRHQSVVSSTFAGSSRSPSVPTIASRGEQPPPKRRRVVRSESVSTDTGSASGLPSETELDWCQLSRSQLQKKWSQAAKKTGAAPIRFCNMVDGEEIPKLSASFKYLESGYNFADDVKRPQDEGFLMTCDCKMCEDADICGCQGESQVVDHTTNSKVYAYYPSGKYKFNVSRGVEVIECNKNCNCGPSSCPNRVSQKPRDVPIEVFKTDERGWGVRSSVAIKRGKVLGLYTGLVIHRKSYIGLSDHASMYIFDLDGDEGSGTENHVPHQLYSVNAMYQGNWTRFINHSCSPNLVVYLVVHDIPSGIGMPFVAFVASKDIPAMTEFTLDYDPKAAEELAAAKASSKGKRKAKQAYLPQNGDHRCSCGSAECRGYMP